MNSSFFGEIAHFVDAQTREMKLVRNVPTSDFEVYSLPKWRQMGRCAKWSATQSRLLAVALAVSVIVSPVAALTFAQEGADGARLEGVDVGTFDAEVRTVYTSQHGLPSDDVRTVAVTPEGVYAGTTQGLVRLANGTWSVVPDLPKEVYLASSSGTGLLVAAGDAVYRLAAGGVSLVAKLPTHISTDDLNDLAVSDTLWLATSQGLFTSNGREFESLRALDRLLGHDRSVRQVAVASDGRVAVAASSGLFARDRGGDWTIVYPRTATRSWAPQDVRGVTFDRDGRLWFASVQGVGCKDKEGWTLFTGHDGLPYNDFTTVAAAEEGVVWFGTRMGAIRYDGAHWAYRQGRRWLPADEVRAIAVTEKGDAWFATSSGVGVIERRPMTLARKAQLLSDAIDKYHRRTPYGYVLEAMLARPDDRSEWSNHDSDNDGLWTAMYGAAECFRYAVTREPAAKSRATKVFEALRFLSEVTQGGTHPTQPGFPARSILPTSGRNPNDHANAERDRARRERDPQWKIIEPRWPVSEDGKWYWKTDTSSDELDGHYFFYACYYDLVAETDDERAAVREVCLAITDHLLRNDFNLIDHDGKPTRWAHFGPQVLNHELWSGGRGLNSLSILSYLKVAEHMSGDARYHDAYEELIKDHGYAMNAVVAKYFEGPGTGNQSDDEMAFMCYYNLLKYAKNPAHRQKYIRSLFSYWRMEQPELCPLFNYIFAACMEGVESRWSRRLMPQDILVDALDTLKRFPLDRVQWALKNSHRIDVELLATGFRRVGRGHRVNGKVLPIDERNVSHWNHDPWQLDYGGDGRRLDDGAAFLLPYYMGLYHGFIVERK